MKRQIILSLVVVFALALFAPAVVSASTNAPAVEQKDSKEKKEEKKAEAKSEKKSEATEKSGSCSGAKSSSCGSASAGCDKK